MIHMMRLGMLGVLLACSGKETEPEPSEPGEPATEPAEPSEPSEPDTDAPEPDSSEPSEPSEPAGEPDDSFADSTGREGAAFCVAGGTVSGDGLSGSFCTGAVDIAAGRTYSNREFTWQPGPVIKLSE